MLKQRIITALILIPITLLAIYYLPLPVFCMLTAIITLAAAWEWTNLMQITKKSYRFLYLALMTMFFVITLFVPVTTIFIAASLWWLFALMLIVIYPRASTWWRQGAFLRGLMGLLVLVPCWAAVNYIRNQEHGFAGLVFLFSLIWGADIAAYFVGKKWGRTQLASAVSPGKSRQGLMGALVATVVIVMIALWICDIAVAAWPWAMALSLVTVLFSVVGDLFESMLKRQAGLKDSGTLLPGHGGLLDRIDSLTAAAPIYVSGALLLSMYLQ